MLRVREGRISYTLPRTGVKALTPREREVASLLCSYPPLTLAEIRGRLMIADNTLRMHMAHMALKLGLETSRSRELAVALMHHKYVSKELD